MWHRAYVMSLPRRLLHFKLQTLPSPFWNVPSCRCLLRGFISKLALLLYLTFLLIIVIPPTCMRESHHWKIPLQNVTHYCSREAVNGTLNISRECSLTPVGWERGAEQLWRRRDVVVVVGAAYGLVAGGGRGRSLHADLLQTLILAKNGHTTDTIFPLHFIFWGIRSKNSDALNIFCNF